MDNQELKERFIELYQKYLGLVFRISLMIILIVLYYELAWNFYTCSRSSFWDSSGNSYTGDHAKFLVCLLRELFRDAEPLVIFLPVSYVLFWFVKKDK